MRPADSPDYPWYDSLWLSAFARAKATVAAVAPRRLAEFEHAFDVLRTRPDFDVRLLKGLVGEERLQQLLAVVAQLTPSQLEMHEARTFKRFVVHDQPEFSRLQRDLVDAVSDAAGEQVEPSYNFLSLYGPRGVCPMHMDSPEAKWTLDLCLRQHEPWPIHFGPVRTWPEPETFASDWGSKVRREIAGRSVTFAPLPGEALLFSGSSQWHFRDPIPPAGGKAFCDLLFFHFIPAGTAELIRPSNWARLFDIPELSQAVVMG